MVDMTDTEKAILTMISSAGSSKSIAFSALQKVKTKEFDEARKLLKDAKEADLAAHNVQTKMIQEAMSGEGDPEALSLLMVHAQDHYMTAQLARDLVAELVDVFEALTLKED